MVGGNSARRIAEIAPSMSKLVKLRLLGSYLDSTKNKEDEELTLIIKKDAAKLAERNRILARCRTRMGITHRFNSRS